MRIPCVKCASAAQEAALPSLKSANVLPKNLSGADRRTTKPHREGTDMPAILTHDFFGKDVYAELFETIGGSKDESDAFLLGNQGPDPLFYSFANPRLQAFGRLGSIMHAEKPSELLCGMKQATSLLPEEDLSIGRAYIAGFLCHYLLDSEVHPFVYACEYAVCDAGVEGLSREDSKEVHAVIESEIDEMVLFTKREETVATYVPHENVLHGSKRVLDVISRLYAYCAITVYGQAVPEGLFASSVRCFRLGQHVLDSPTGIKRALFGKVEELMRPHSFLRSMSHRPIASAECQFDNRDRLAWENPFTGEVRKASFWDLYDAALARALVLVPEIMETKFTLEDARKVTGEKNFSGEPTVATIVAVHDAPVAR